MSFIDWMNMNMILDISFLVFTCAFIWKLKKQNKKLQTIIDENQNINRKIIIIQDNLKDLDTTYQKTQNDLFLVMKNPQAARRILKERAQ